MTIDYKLLTIYMDSNGIKSQGKCGFAVLKESQTDLLPFQNEMIGHKPFLVKFENPQKMNLLNCSFSEKAEIICFDEKTNLVISKVFLNSTNKQGNLIQGLYGYAYALFLPLNHRLGKNSILNETKIHVPYDQYSYYVITREIYRIHSLKKDLPVLVERFNKEVGNPGWTSTRAQFLSALHICFEESGYDCSGFIRNNGMSLKKKLRVDYDTRSINTI